LSGQAGRELFERSNQVAGNRAVGSPAGHLAGHSIQVVVPGCSGAVGNRGGCNPVVRSIRVVALARSVAVRNPAAGVRVVVPGCSGAVGNLVVRSIRVVVPARSVAVRNPAAGVRVVVPVDIAVVHDPAQTAVPAAQTAVPVIVDRVVADPTPLLS